MGCWNGICFLSNLSIRHGDPIHLQFIVETVYRNERKGFDIDGFTSTTDPREINSLTYPNRMYSPVGFPIKGRYNDYGGIENIKNDISSEVMTTVIRGMIDAENILCLGDGDSWMSHKNKDKPQKLGMEAMVPIDPNNLEKFTNLAERGMIIIRNENRIWLRLRFVMMHTDVYNSTLKLGYNEPTFGGGSMKTYLKTLQEDILNVLYHEVKPNNPDKLLVDLAEALAATYEDIQDDATKSVEEKAIAKKESDRVILMVRSSYASAYWRQMEYTEMTYYPTREVRTLVGTCGVEKASKILDLYGDAHALFIFLMATSRSWAPTMGGSQDDNHSVINKHLTNITKFIKAKKAKDNEDS